MASTLHVALYHPARLPVEGYGGTERVVVWLARGLAELGVRVTLLAAPRSNVPEATLVPVPPASKKTEGRLDLTPFLPDGVDLLHAHVPLHRAPATVPVVWTLHGNATPGETLPPGAVGLSADHARRHGLSRWVHNGLDPAEYRFMPVKSHADLFLGRLHSVKGWQWAVAGAQRTGRQLIVAGGWRPTLQRGIRFVGEVKAERKISLLASAACLWNPVQWDEPFGLTSIEAMVSGTPVLGTRRGALPEIVTPDAGALGTTLDELVALRPTLDALEPERVRARVLEHFTHRAMAERYLAIYREMIGRG
jgi:glycosyltransferase involved in cell wall biosynthesis